MFQGGDHLKKVTECVLWISSWSANVIDSSYSNQIFVPMTCCHSPLCWGLYMSLLELSPRHGKVVCITQCSARLRPVFLPWFGRRACRRGMAESPCNIQPNWTRVATCAGPILQQLSVALTSLALASWRQRVVQAVVRVRFFPRIDLFCKDAGFCLAFSEAWFLLVNECSGWMTIGRKSLILIYSLYVNERERCIIIYIYNSYNCILIYL